MEKIINLYSYFLGIIYKSNDEVDYDILIDYDVLIDYDIEGGFYKKN